MGRANSQPQLTGMKDTINNVPEEARQDFIYCIRDFDKLLKEIMNQCVALKDIVDDLTSAISNINKLKRLANEHGRAVVGNPTFRTFAEKARNNVASSQQKTGATHSFTEHLIKQYNALGQKFAGLQKLLEDRSAHFGKIKWIFVGAASALAIGTAVRIVLPAVLPPARVAAGSAVAAAGVGGLMYGGVICSAVASTAAAGAAMAAAYQGQAADIEDNLKKLAVVSTTATKLLEILSVKCGTAQNAGRHVGGSLAVSDDRLDLNVLFTNLQEDNDMDSLDKYKKSLQELRRSIDDLEKESATQYENMVAFF